MVASDIVALYVDCLEVALPFTFIFWACDYLVQTILRAAFGGKLTLRS